MDQNDQRDYAEEAANRALLHEEEEVDSKAEDYYSNYTAEIVQLYPEEDAIRIANGDAEAEFFVDPAAWPTLCDKINEAHEKWLETSPRSPRAECAVCLEKGGKHTDWCQRHPSRATNIYPQSSQLPNSES